MCFQLKSVILLDLGVLILHSLIYSYYFISFQYKFTQLSQIRQFLSSIQLSLIVLNTFDVYNISLALPTSLIFNFFLYTARNRLCGYDHGLIINMYFNRSNSSIPILITLITKEEANKTLLMEEVEEEFGQLILGFDVIAQSETVARFG